jgi:ATP-binding cassette, subfamily B, bacterial
VSAPFEPVGVTAEYPAPRAEIAPDPKLGWVRRLLPLLWSRSPLFAGSITTLLAVTLIGVSLPQVVKHIIDFSIYPAAGAAREPVGPAVTALIGLGLLQLAFGYVSGVLTSRTNQSIEYDLRALIYGHLSRLSFAFYDRAQSGQLISRANADIRALQMFLAFAPRLLGMGLSFGLALGLMIHESWLMALAAMSTVPFVYLLGLAMRSRLFPNSWLIQARQADIAGIVDENVSGVRIVKSFGAEQSQIGTLAKAAERLRWAEVKQVDVRARFSPILTSLPGLSRVLVLAVGGWLAIEGQTTIGAIVMFNSYIVRVQAPFRMVGFLMIMAQRAAASAVRIFELIDEVPDVRDRPGAVHLTEPRGEIEFRKVSFGYARGPRVLDELDLHVRPGETVALVGRTGSGKSTLVRLLPRFYDVDGGEILVDGGDVRSYTQKSLRAHVGMVLDEPFLFSDSVRNNIAYARPDAPLDEIVDAAASAGAHEFIVQLEHGYDTLIGERGYTLSGGQRQRIAIARTLLANPKILVLDDATSSIDVQLEHQIHDALRRLMKGRTTLIIAHRLSTIRLADRVVLLSGGRVIADGRHDDLIANVKEYAEILSRADEPRVRPARPAGGRPVRPAFARPAFDLGDVGGLDLPGLRLPRVGE